MDRKSLNSSSNSQRARIMAYLKANGRATTCELRKELDILSPAPRILELRRRGYIIETDPVDIETELGRHSGVACYVLISEPEGVSK